VAVVGAAGVVINDEVDEIVGTLFVQPRQLVRDVSTINSRKRGLRVYLCYPNFEYWPSTRSQQTSILLLKLDNLDDDASRVLGQVNEGAVALEAPTSIQGSNTTLTSSSLSINPRSTLL
jgi:hypothetical protein